VGKLALKIIWSQLKQLRLPRLSIIDILYRNITTAVLESVIIRSQVPYLQESAPASAILMPCTTMINKKVINMEFIIIY